MEKQSCFCIVKNHFYRAVIPFIPLILLASLTGCGAAKSPQGVSAGASTKNENMVPVGDDFAPGLSVIYFEGFYRHIDQMPSGLAARFNGEPGKPISFLDHRFGNGFVFDSGRSRGVGMELTGFIHFPGPGRYEFKALANDGIRFFVGDTVIFEDPDQHSDRFSPAGEVSVEAETRLPVRILYFQRKGTAALQMYWKPPGKQEFEIVPPEAYSHSIVKK